ncbi:hypothetical protein [Streptomyces sp. RPT161]|uniref:hypothetical protein n=1 Tax=Streptomyces sp. RPT161 TaxID=3015993 RepID=UPI0022B8A29B|nr:hypothetical protein [Streptomyces sp. RPT161]
MPTVALMWEARAVSGRGADLLAWVRELKPDGERQPLRREVLTAPEDRVLVITWWEGGYRAEVPELPDPPADLVRRAVHRWRFESVGG